MADYDLLVLSWSEFENLTKDLLEKRLNIYMESFTAGRDGGIDLRFSLTKSKKAIVQCKRYEKYSDLLTRLKKEAKIIKKKEIERYYISTTVGLTPKRKREIYDLFKPLIRNEEDIFGKSEINSMLSLYKDVETKYYKLWLSSTNILRKIIHSRIYNTSQLDRKSVGDIAKIYVQNESMQKAKEIIEKHHYVIISGIPGIGKTTLAKIMVYTLLANGTEEMIAVTQSINEAYELYHESPSQVFLYDDFLGRNFLETKLDKNEDSQLIRFIKTVKESKNKYLVMTTREYILRQAQIKYELLNKHDIDVAKCTIDLSQYTKMIRAKILYNHLFFSDMPAVCLEELVKEQRYKKVIEHQNYNPRIIETILDRKDWDENEEGTYFKKFLSYFNNPKSVWRHAFENQITPLSQQILVVAGSLDCDIEYSNLKKATKSYITSYDSNLYTASFDINYDMAIKELEGSFIRIEKDCESTFVITYINPSISDFLRSYIFEKKELTKQILSSSIFLEQLITIRNMYKNIKSERIRNNMEILCEEEIKIKFGDIEMCEMRRVQYVGKPSFTWELAKDKEIERIAKIVQEMKPVKNKELNRELASAFLNEYNSGINSSEIGDAIILFISLHKHLDVSFKEFLDYLFENNKWVLNLVKIKNLEEVDSAFFKKYINQNEIRKKIEEIVEMECDDINVDYIEYTKSNLVEIENRYSLNLSEYIGYLDEELDRYQSEQDEVNFDQNFESHEDEAEDSEDLIKEMFDSLLIKAQI